MTAVSTNGKPKPPTIAAPNEPMAGPKIRPPIDAAENRPNASPRSSSAVESTIVPRAAGSYIAANAPPRNRRTNSAAGSGNASGSAEKMPRPARPTSMSGRRGTRSASQPKNGSANSLAAGHAARMIPSVASSMPCSTTYSGMTGSSAPNPTSATNSATKIGMSRRQRSTQARPRRAMEGDIGPIVSAAHDGAGGLDRDCLARLAETT
jgi:hypothetical protein